MLPEAAQPDTAGGAAAVEPGPGPAAVLPHNKGLVRSLTRAARELHPVRFTALLTDGGVDGGSLHYWADHMFIPNAWAPYCARYSDNVNVLAVIKTGPGATSELRHRSLLIGCLQHVLPLLQHPQELQLGPGGELPPLDPARLAEAEEQLSKWRTLRLEAFFVQVAARLMLGDPLGLALLAGLPGPRAEARQAALTLGAGIQVRSWYERAYHLRFLEAGQPQQREQQQQRTQSEASQAGAGGRRLQPANIRRVDAQYVMDERAVQEDLLSQGAASSVALLHGVSVSREGRVSCPVLSGALLAGMLPPGWPATVQGRAPQGEGRAQGEAGAGAGDTGGLPVPLAPCEAVLRASLQQPAVAALDDKTDAASVLSACDSGQLPPWVRHVVCPHAEWIEFLPRHLGRYAPSRQAAGAGPGGQTEAGAAGSDGTPADVPRLHPVMWFRFTEHAEYNRRRPTHRARGLLRNLSELYGGAAELLDGAPLAAAAAAAVPEFGSDSDTDNGSVGVGVGGRGRGLTWLLDAVAITINLWAEGDSDHDGDGDDGDEWDQAEAGDSPLAVLSARLRAAERLAHRIVSLLSSAAMLGPNVAAASGFPQQQQEAALQRALGLCVALRSALEELGGLAEELDADFYEEDFQQTAVAAAMAGMRRRRSSDSSGGGDGMYMGDVGSAVADAYMGLQARWRRDAGRQLRHVLEGHAEVLGQGAQEERRAAAAELRRVAADAAAAAAPPEDPAVQERRNEALLRRLPLEVPLPLSAGATVPAGTEAAAPAAAASPASPSAAGVDGGGPLVQPLSGPHAALEPPPPDGWAAERLFDPRLQADVDDGLAELPEPNREGHRVVHLSAPLLLPVAANVVAFKAVRPENLMGLVGWDEAEEPNVDVQYVGLQGRMLRLPSAVQAVAAE